MADNFQEKYGELTERYTKLENVRSQLEATWENCAKLTLPYLFPSKTYKEGTAFDTPYNSIGPSAVNTLSSKMLLALFPPTGNFFRLMPYEEKIASMTDEQKKKLDKELSVLERDVNEYINIKAIRVPMYEAIKLLITTGNALIYKVPGGSVKVFNPYQYVVARDYAGNVIEIIIKEEVNKNILPTEVFAKLDLEESEEETVDVYTAVFRTPEGTWDSYQEVEGELLESTVNSFKDGSVPYIPLRWSSTFNTDYGIGLVEQYLGDLRSLEALSQIMLEGSAVMANVIFGLRPGSTTNLDDLNDAENGQFIMGDLEKDVTTLQVGKNADFNIPFQMMGQLEQRLGRGFLLAQGAIRDSERTTAAEVRLTANELEAGLGGAYSVLAQDVQLPMLRLILEDIEDKVLSIAEPSIVTGLSAISREKDFQNLQIMGQSIAQFGPAAINMYLDLGNYFAGMATSLGIDASTIVRTKEEVEKLQQQAQAAQAQQQGGGGGMPPPQQ